jgi:hypothetical protein
LELQITRAIRQTIGMGSKRMVIPLPWYNLPVWPEESMSLCVAQRAGTQNVDGEGNVVCCLREADHDGNCG